jgi:hypothetical protein
MFRCRPSFRESEHVGPGQWRPADSHDMTAQPRKLFFQALGRLVSPSRQTCMARKAAIKSPERPSVTSGVAR